MLRLAGLTERRREPVRNFSGGMQRRLNLVCGLVHRPRLLLLDEPTVGVDMSARERVHELLRRLRTNGLAMLLTTHDLTQAEALADRVAVDFVVVFEQELGEIGTVLPSDASNQRCLRHANLARNAVSQEFKRWRHRPRAKSDGQATY